jgi:hypothetical protein
MCAGCLLYLFAGCFVRCSFVVFGFARKKKHVPIFTSDAGWLASFCTQQLEFIHGSPPAFHHL